MIITLIVEPIINTFYHNKLNKLKRQVLPIDRSLIKSYTVQSGQADLSHYNIISGHQLPEQIIIGMVEQTAHGGRLSKNPFNFQHFDISEASLVVNGIHEPMDLMDTMVPMVPMDEDPFSAPSGAIGGCGRL